MKSSIRIDSNQIVYAAFCGTGKSYLCNDIPEKYKEIECWEYRKGDFPSNYIHEVKKLLGSEHGIIFISTDPVILKQLHKEGIKIILIYPDNLLKGEYMKRYCERNSSYDFIGAIYKHWDQWIDELKEQAYCERIIMQKGQYLSDILA